MNIDEEIKSRPSYEGRGLKFESHGHGDWLKLVVPLMRDVD